MAEWDQLVEEGESEEAYRAFLVFLDLPLPRFYVDAYRQTFGKPAEIEAPMWFREWAKVYRWKDRALARDTVLRQAADQAALDAAKKIGESRVKAYGALIGAGMTILTKAQLGKLSETQARKLMRFVVPAVDAGAKGQRAEAGLPTEVIRSEQTGVGGAPIQMQQSDGLATRIGRYLRAAPEDARQETIDEWEQLQTLIKRLGARTADYGE